jgi:protein ImuB
MTRILCLWFPNWAIQRAIRGWPALKGRPVVLVGFDSRGKTAPGSAGGSGSGLTNRQFKTPGRAGGYQQIGSGIQNTPSIVAACCSKAVAKGVRPGMPVAEAQSLVCDLCVAAYEPAADRRALVKLAQACERFSPRVAVEEGEAPESLLLDISNLEHLYGEEAKLVEQVEKFFTQREYRVRLAVGETVGAAWAAAHFQAGTGDWGLGAGESRESRIESQEPEGLVRSPWALVRENTMDNGQTTRYLVQSTQDSVFNPVASASSPQPLVPSPQSPAPLPIEALRIANDTAALLRQLGIETVDQLLALPREELASRFGEELLRRLDQLIGREQELIEPQRWQSGFAASYALEEPTGDRVVLMHVLRQLVDRLSRQLAARDEGAVVLVCWLYLVGTHQPPALPGVLPRQFEICSRHFHDQQGHLYKPPAEPGATGIYQNVPTPNVSLRIGLLQPSANARQLLELIELHLENVRLPGEVDRVELRAVVTGRLSERQRELFADRWFSDSHQLAVLMNRLSSRLGCNRVLRAELLKSAAPERAVGWRPVTGTKTKEVKRKDKEKSWKSNSPCLPLSLSPCLPSRPLTLYPEAQAAEVVCVAPDGPPQFVWRGRHRERIVGCVGPERIETLWWRGPSLRRDYYRVATESGDHLWMFRRLRDGKWFMHGAYT